MPVSSLLTTWPPEPSQAENRPSILVVDDSSIATFIKRHIEAYDVVQVADPDRLAEEITLHHPQAVIVNVQPGERPEYGDVSSMPVPFIECSLPSQSRMAGDLEVAACLTKPISAKSLLAEIGRLDKHDDILIVDDDRGFCHLVERILQTSGNSFDVRLAYDGEDGLSAMRTRRPDLVLLDLIMPGIDGFQVLETMRRDVCLVDVPVILLTATSYAEDALTQRGNRIVIRRPGGLHPAETLRCLEAVIGAFDPNYGEQVSLEEIVAGESRGLW